MTGAAKDREARVLGEAGIGVGKSAAIEGGAAIRGDLAHEEAGGAEARRNHEDSFKFRVSSCKWGIIRVGLTAFLKSCRSGLAALALKQSELAYQTL